VVIVELISTATSKVLQLTRKELKYYLEQATESFITGKRRIIFPTDDGCTIDSVVVYEDV